MGVGRKRENSPRQPNFKPDNGNYKQDNWTGYKQEDIKAWTIKDVGFNSEKAPILGTYTSKTTSKGSS